MDSSNSECQIYIRSIIMNKNKKTPNNKDAVNFGFQKVTAEQKRLLVDEVFSDVAGKYDLMMQGVLVWYMLLLLMS